MVTERDEREDTSILGTLEKRLGLPSLRKVAESLDKMPDAKQLHAIKDILIVAERVSHTAPELDQVVALMREINSMPLERLEKLEKVLKRIEGIIKKAPQEVIDFISSLREE